MNSGSRSLRTSIVVALGGLALSLTLVPSSASAAGTPTVVPITTFTVTSSQCDGPNYLPTLFEGSLLAQVAAEIAALEGLPPGSGSVPTVTSCTPLPAALSPVLGSASVSSVASPNGSATIAVQALGNDFVEQSAQVDTTLAASITLNSPASSVEVSVPYTNSPYTTSGDSPSSGDSAFALVSFGQAPGLIMCVDGSYGIWSNPPGQYDLEAPMGAGSGTAGVLFSCPDGSELAPGVVRLGIDLLASADSENGQTASASANIDVQGVTATINP